MNSVRWGSVFVGNVLTDDSSVYLSAAGGVRI